MPKIMGAKNLRRDDLNLELFIPSTLYRLLEKVYFDEYLWTDGKRKYLELNPKGKKSLAQKIASNIQWRSNALHVRN